MEITRELLEQYLRATGWDAPGPDSGDAWFHAGLSGGEAHRVSPRVFEAASVWAIRVLGHHELRHEQVIAFRLCLCACAERCLTHAAELGRANVAVGHGVLLSQAAEFLNEAGIELVAWERARHKGVGDGDL